METKKINQDVAVEERLYRWVKAKDRMPENESYNHFVRCKAFNGDIYNATIDSEHWSDVYEWLEEIPIKEHLPVEPGTKWNIQGLEEQPLKEDEQFLKKVIVDLFEGFKADNGYITTEDRNLDYANAILYAKQLSKEKQFSIKKL